LNALCQRLTGQSMSKTDITYETVRHGNQFQSTANMVCLDGQQAAGELSATEKAAEQSAAYQGIMGLEQELGALGYGLSERTLEIPASVRQAAITAGVYTTGQNIQEHMTDSAIKGMMHTILQQILDRKVEAGDFVYEYGAGATAGLHVATLQLPKIEGDLGSQTWQGTASPFKRDAQLDCVLKAMDSILTDPIFSEKIEMEGKVPIKSSSEKKQREKESKRKRQEEAIANGEMPAPSKGKKGKGNGKGGGKGGYVWMGAQDMQMMQMMRMMMMGGGCMGGKGYGGKGGKGKK